MYIQYTKKALELVRSEMYVRGGLDRLEMYTLVINNFTETDAFKQK